MKALPYIVVVIAFVAATGCTSPTGIGPPHFYDPDEIVGPYHPTKPLVFSAVYLSEVGGSPSDIAAGYSGSIAGCVNLNNSNDQPTWFHVGHQYYQIVPDGTGDGLRLVDPGSEADRTIHAHQEALAIAPLRWMPVNETANGSTRYVIHFWADITTHTQPYVPIDPPLHTDKWINVTYTPFANGVLYHEGGSC